MSPEPLRAVSEYRTACVPVRFNERTVLPVLCPAGGGIAPSEVR